MTDSRSVVDDWFDFTPPSVTWLFLPGGGGLPSNAAAFFEFDHVIDPRFAAGVFHGEGLADFRDALPLISVGQIIIAVPFGLPRRIRNELEDLLRRSGHFAFSADNALFIHGPTLPLLIAGV